jgi:hypothetical protein
MLVRLPSAIARISRAGFFVVFSVFALTGCASLENAADHAHDFAARHPVVAAVGVAVVVGGAIAASEAGHHHHESTTIGPARRPGCGRVPC